MPLTLGGPIELAHDMCCLLKRQCGVDRDRLRSVSSSGGEVRAGIEAPLGKPLAQRHDLVLESWGHLRRRCCP